MNSLQKPRKIKIKGTDGVSYGFLCKPRDDLRKDARLMEFNNMINRFLKKDAECSRRRLCMTSLAPPGCLNPANSPVETFAHIVSRR